LSGVKKSIQVELTDLKPNEIWVSLHYNGGYNLKRNEVKKITKGVLKAIQKSQDIVNWSILNMTDYEKRETIFGRFLERLKRDIDPVETRLEQFVKIHDLNRL
jgi:hypothetical protein